MGKRVFVTVGTTEFNSLIENVCKPENLLILKQLGYTDILLQIGNGKYVPDESITAGHEGLEGMTINYFRYKNSILDDILNSDLIISHAGAGTCLEVLRAGKLLLTVVNEQLMDNHQFELAQEFHKNGYLYYCTCDTLSETLRQIDSNQLKSYPEGNISHFVDYLNKCMGFDESIIQISRVEKPNAKLSIKDD